MQSAGSKFGLPQGLRQKVSFVGGYSVTHTPQTVPFLLIISRACPVSQHLCFGVIFKDNQKGSRFILVRVRAKLLVVLLSVYLAVWTLTLSP